MQLNDMSLKQIKIIKTLSCQKLKRENKEIKLSAIEIFSPHFFYFQQRE